MHELVRGMCIDWGASIRRACGALRFDTSTFHYKSRRTDQAAVERRIREICETRVRYGYRRVHVLLRREGWQVNIKKPRRIYNELGLQLRNKNPKRRVKAKLRDDRQEAVGPTRPVLDAIRAVLKFKDHATIAEVAKFADMRPRQVLGVINANGNMVWRNRKNGHITKVAPSDVLRR